MVKSFSKSLKSFQKKIFYIKVFWENAKTFNHTPYNKHIIRQLQWFPHYKLLTKLLTKN